MTENAVLHKIARRPENPCRVGCDENPDYALMRYKTAPF